MTDQTIEASEVHTDEVHTDEICTDEICTDEICTDEAHTDKVLSTGRVKYAAYNTVGAGPCACPGPVCGRPQQGARAGPPLQIGRNWSRIYHDMYLAYCWLSFAPGLRLKLRLRFATKERQRFVRRWQEIEFES